MTPFADFKNQQYDYEHVYCLYGILLALFPGHCCGIKSGSGLGMRLVYYNAVTLIVTVELASGIITDCSWYSQTFLLPCEMDLRTGIALISSAT